MLKSVKRLMYALKHLRQQFPVEVFPCSGAVQFEEFVLIVEASQMACFDSWGTC